MNLSPKQLENKVPVLIVEKPIKHGDDPARLYRVANGVCYNILTPDEVINVLEQVRGLSTRVKLFYGYTQHPPIGCDWVRDDAVTEGFICRSNNAVLSVPLILADKKAQRGYFVHSESVVKILNMRTDEVLYQHPKYHHPKVEIRKISQQIHPESTHGIFIDGEMRYHFMKHRHAKLWASNRYLTVSFDEGE